MAGPRPTRGKYAEKLKRDAGRPRFTRPVLYHFLIWPKEPKGLQVFSFTDAEGKSLVPIFKGRADAEEFLVAASGFDNSNVDPRDWEVSIAIPPEGLMLFAQDFAEAGLERYAVNPPPRPGRQYQWYAFNTLFERAHIRLMYEIVVAESGLPPGQRVHMTW